MSAVNDFVNRKVPRKADGRIDFRPKRHHGFSFFIMLCGWLLPPLAVAVRFGIGKDFFINVICTICGYFPGHGHNFFIQNIRNNERQNRTPKWATRYGLVEDFDKKRQKKRAWTGRYNDRTSERQMYDDDGVAYTYNNDHRFEDGDNPGKARERVNNRVEGIDDRYYGGSQNGSAQSGLSVRRSASNRSLNNGSGGYGDVGGYGGCDGPGAGEAERRRAKKSAGMRGLLGSKKGKADRHARSEQVMGAGDDGDYVRRNHYDSSMNDSLEDSRRDSFGDDGPEDPDATVRKQYTGRANGISNSNSRSRYQADPLDSKVIPLAPARPAPAVDIMDQRHEF